MLITASSDKDYTATHVGIKMRFFYKEALQCQLEVRTAAEGRRLLADWARLKLPPAQIQQYYVLIKTYVGATVDDVSIRKDGKYCINGKLVEEI